MEIIAYPTFNVFIEDETLVAINVASELNWITESVRLANESFRHRSDSK